MNPSLMQNISIPASRQESEALITTHNDTPVPDDDLKETDTKTGSQEQHLPTPPNKAAVKHAKQLNNTHAQNRVQ